MASAVHYEIPQDPGGGKGLLLAVLVHLLLIVFLWIGVSWQSDHTASVEAEVWNLKFEDAAPRPVKTLLPVRKKIVEKPVAKPIPKPKIDPEIALKAERRKKRLAEERKKRLAKEKAQKAAAEKRRKQRLAEKKRKRELAEQKARDQAWVEQMRRNVAAAGSGGSGTAVRSAGRLSNAYAAKIRAKIRSNTVFTVPPGLNGNPDVQYAIELLPDGTLRRAPRRLKSSGIPGFDQAVARAIGKSVPFPRDKDGKVPAKLTIIHRPKD